MIKTLLELVSVFPFKRGRSTLRLLGVLVRDLGHARSARSGKAEDAAGNPWPWYTYPAIEYLEQFDFSDKSVFEYGSGQSTLFWGSRARRVVSVESSKDWFDQVSRRIPQHCQLVHASGKNEYVEAIAQNGGLWDVIVIDGDSRPECAELAPRHLAPGGIIIFDNTDWFPRAAASLRSNRFIEVDFAGPGPSNAYIWTTSVFFDRQFNFPIRSLRQPSHPRGGLGHDLG